MHYPESPKVNMYILGMFLIFEFVHPLWETSFNIEKAEYISGNKWGL